MKLTNLKARFLATWRDLNTEPVWRYQELPPFQLRELRGLTSCIDSDSELSRAVWFWERRPKSVFYESGTAWIVEGVCMILSVIIAVFKWPLTSISGVAGVVITLFFSLAIEIGAIADRVRYIHWRRDYEQSVNRLIRTIYPAV